MNPKKKEDIKNSYTALLLSKGFSEAINNNTNIIHESADLIYHFLVTLESRGIKLIDVIMELEKRKNQSGHEEKKNRTK